MADPWDKLEAELRQARPAPLSRGAKRQILMRLRRRTTARRVWWAGGGALAAAACVVIGLTVWPGADSSDDPTKPAPVAATPARPKPPSPSPAAVHVELAGGWQVQPTAGAAYRMVSPDRIRLDRGEIQVTCAKPGASARSPVALCIDTPCGSARAEGTDFYIGTHQPAAAAAKGAAMTRITRILVLAGVVTLTTPLGTVTGGANELLAAEAGQPPVKLAVQANSDFAFDLYQQLAKENAGKNMFFSPYSVSSALAMTAEGARGKTAEEMGTVLRFPKEARRIGSDAQLIPWRTLLIHTGMNQLNQQLMGKDDATEKAARDKIASLQKAFDAAKAKAESLKKARNYRELFRAQRAEQKAARELNEALAKVDQYELRVANALWGEKTYPFLDTYVNTVKKHYDTGGLFPCDFKSNFPAERKKINQWVEEQTHNRIKDLIPELSPAEARLVRLILTNAIYFKGEWSETFKEANTKPRDFLLADGTKVQTPIMHAPNLKAGRYGAFDADGSAFDTPRRIKRGQKAGLYPGAKGFAVMELPYKGDEISMVLIAPNSPDDLAAIEKQFTPTALTGWLAKLQNRKVHVYLPKFKLETEYRMSDTLKAMGMPTAFSPARADFTGMSASRASRDRLSISKVIHKAFVEVSEKGTEAAAATAVIMIGRTAAAMSVPFIPTFRADRPFVFVIRDKRSGSILFVGRMLKPQK